MKEAQVIDRGNGSFDVYIPDGVTEVDVTEAVFSGHWSILPGIAYDQHNDRIWVHAKLLNKFTRFDKAAAKCFILVEWYKTRQYETSLSDYNEYLRYIKRNAKLHRDNRNHASMNLLRSVGGTA